MASMPRSAGSPPRRRGLSWPARPYLLAVLLVLAASLLRGGLDPLLGPHVPLLFYLAAVVISARSGGLAPGLFSTALAAVAGTYLFLPPRGQFWPLAATDSARLIIFATGGVIISAVAEWLQAARRRADQHAGEARREHEMRERAEVELRQAHALLQIVTDSLPAYVTYIDAEERCRFNNRACEEWFGPSRERIIGQPVREVMDPATYQMLQGYMRQALAGQTVTYEHPVVAADGSQRHMRGTCVPDRGEQGHVRGFVALVQDLTAQHLAQAQLEASEQYHRTLADALPHVVWTARPDGVVDHRNERWVEYTGVASDDVDAWRLAVHTDDLPACLEAWGGAFRSGEPFQIEFRLRCASDGTYRWHLGRGRPVRDQRGRVLRWIGTATDIDDQRRATDTARFLADASAQLGSDLDYETTLAAVGRMAIGRLADYCMVDLLQEDGSVRPVLVAHVDPDQESVVRELRQRMPFDPAFPYGLAKVLRTGQPELVPEIPEDMLAAYARDAELRRILRVLDPTSYMSVPMVARGRKLGALTFVATRRSRHYGTGDLQIAQDLAHRAALAVDNARLYLEAQEANRMKDEFLATLSHELRTPLNAVLGWTRLLRLGKLDATRAREALDIVERNASAQAELIEDLLDLSRVITGRLRLNLASTHLPQVVEAAVDTCRPAAAAKHQDLRVSISPVDVIICDRVRIQQVVWNLLTNAIKFTPPAGVIEVRLEVSGEYAEILVCDTGIGIAKEFLPYVFDRFRQADSGSTRAYGGLGLGLAIVRHLVELHGGRVSVSSPGPNRGATFSVQLPLRSAHHVESAGRRRPQTVEESLPVSAGKTALGGIRVLIVEDDADALDLVSMILEQHGACVFTAGSVREALAAQDDAPVDVLVADIGLPGEDGYQLIRHVRARQRPDGMPLPAIALSAYARPEDRAQAIASGFQVHLAKPVDADRLVSAIAGLVRARMPGGVGE
jgi:PAS domain S-box-containing protein